MTLKRMIAMALALAMCCSFAACGGDKGEAEPGQNLSGEAEYVVNIVDALGNPYTQTALVKFMQDGQQKAMQQAKDGVVTKTLPRGEYTLELQLPDCQQTFVYNTEAKLTATETTVDLTVTYELGEQTMELYVSEEPVHFVAEGCTTVPVTGGTRTYYLYNMTRAGKFEFTVVGDATIGYYGATHMVQDISAVEVVNNVFSLDVKDGQIGGQPLVIGLDHTADTEVILCITRVGDPTWGVEDEPVQTYQPSMKLSAYTLPAGAKLVDFDLTAESYTLVKDENGFYHLNTADGPLVLTYLGVKSRYLDPLQLVSEKSSVSKVFWSDPENRTKESFQKKESYNACINAYCEVMDQEAGVFPLTDDLMYILQQHGDYYGWWNIDSYSYLFLDENGVVDTTVNPDVAWLFACCYIG